VPNGLSKEEAFRKLMGRMEQEEIPGTSIPRFRSRIRPRIFLYAAAASVALIFALVFTFPEFQQVKLMAGAGEQPFISLPDGSGVYLNAMSDIRYSEKKFQKNRTVRLNGEACFEVKEGDLFTVTSKQGKIKVLGTTFNVHSRDDYFKVSCIAGRVLVEIASARDTIGPGESISLIFNEYRKVREPENIYAISWRDGEFHYESTELRFVLDEIERQFNVSIKASGIEDRRFTGSFYSGNLKQALEFVCIPMELDFEIMEEGKVSIFP
jgi:ferric-dicitrate binding protein FerR (iron transport regulator)